MIDSILNSVKDKLPGVYVEDGDTVFDNQLIDFINAAFTDLFMLGYGPDPVYQITGPENVWSEYITDPAFNDIKVYMLQFAKPLCSTKFFDETVTATKYNKGEVFEKMVTESYGQEWKKDNVPFTEDGDLTADGIAYQIKFEKATFTNEKSLHRLEMQSC